MLRIVSFLALLPLYVRWNILYGAAPSLVLFWDKVNCEDTVDHVWLVCNYMLTWKEKIGFLLKGNPQLQEHRNKSAAVQAEIIAAVCQKGNLSSLHSGWEKEWEFSQIRAVLLNHLAEVMTKTKLPENSEERTEVALKCGPSHGGMKMKKRRTQTVCQETDFKQTVEIFLA